MAKGKKRKGKGGGRPVASGAALLDELAEAASSIRDAPEESAGPLWGAAHKLLLRVKADPASAGRVIATRDLDGLDALVREARGEAPEASAPSPTPAPAATPDHDVPPETLKRAMKAFRKRLKLTRLDHESKLGVGPMTSGKKAEVDAILPPRDFPTAVWDALAAEGLLRRAGQGFYELLDHPPE